MKKVSFGIAFLALISVVGFSSTSCKKERGICYCKYYSGDKTEYDLKDLPRSEQKDSCAHLNSLAANFAGDCKLK